MKKNFTKICLFVFLCLMFTLIIACKNNNNDNTLRVDFKEPETYEVSIGTQFVLEYEIINGDGSAFFTSSDSSIIKVTDEGIVKPSKEGIATVTVLVMCNDENETEFSHEYEFIVVDNREFTVYFNTDGGSLSQASHQMVKGEVYTLPTPEKQGYAFLGWKYNKNDLDYVTTVSGLKENITLYAFYEKTGFDVKYNLYGGKYPNAVESVERGGTLILGTPERPGYIFLGWSLTPDGKEYISGIYNIVNDIELYAHYEEEISMDENEIAYILNGGSLKYNSREEVISDFIADLNKVCNKSFKNASSISTDIWGELDYFPSFFVNSEMSVKWKWLVEYLANNAVTSSNKSALNKVLAGAKVSGDSDPYSLSYEVRAFLQGTVYRETNSTYKTCDYSSKKYANGFFGTLSKYEAKVYEYTDTLPTPYLYNYDFAGWYKDPEFKDGPYTNGEKQTMYYAKWIEGNKVERIDLNNPINEIEVNKSFQLNWNVVPSNANIQDVEFSSSDKYVATVDEKGFVQTIGTGNVKITIKSLSSSGKTYELKLEVFKPDHFEVSYETNSFVGIGESIKLNADYVKRDGTKASIIWSSLDESLATVDNDGIVTAHKEGLAQIRATVKDTNEKFDFTVTVLNNELSDALKLVIENHNSNALVEYNLGIGAGTPEYYYDVVGSVNNILFDPLKIDRTYYDKLPSGTKNYGPMTSVEFICVHYTGNMNVGADADNNCDYFNNLGYDASIHFVTGRSNLYKDYCEEEYYAFAGLNEKYGAWHASTGKNAIVWDKTGVKYSEADPETPVISIEDGMYTINGNKTNIKVPSLPDGYTLKGDKIIVGGSEYTAINKMGLITKVVEGEYCLGRTYWGSQRSPYALCTYGGNTNSIGIESCVDIGSDLIHTWHVTAQLVAKLLVDNNLGFDRVVGHHFFSAKDCPQPLIAGDMELWNEFMNMVKAEYALLTTYKDAKYSMEVVESGNVLSNIGLLVQDENAHIVTYKVKVESNGKTEYVTLATAVNSYYTCNEFRKEASLQVKGYDVR